MLQIAYTTSSEWRAPYQRPAYSHSFSCEKPAPPCQFGNIQYRCRYSRFQWQGNGIPVLSLPLQPSGFRQFIIMGKHMATFRICTHRRVRILSRSQARVGTGAAYRPWYHGYNQWAKEWNGGRDLHEASDVRKGGWSPACKYLYVWRYPPFHESHDEDCILRELYEVLVGEEHTYTDGCRWVSE